MKPRPFLISFILLNAGILFSQTSVQFNVLGDLGFSIAGDKSHYYYNGIDEDHTAARIKLSQLNLIAKINFDEQWIFNSRLLLERDKDLSFDKFQIPQLNLQWLSKQRKIGLTAGIFTNPFGSFNEKQLSTERDFIGLPLAYAFYVNISDKIGFMEGMGDVNKTAIDGSVQWGSSIVYYGGYSAGTLFSWNIKPTKINWKIALVTGASNLQQRFTDPLNIGLVSRLKTQPTYFWEQGFSVSHGSFLRRSEVSNQLNDLGQFRQTIIGTDYKLGHGFFEFSGEIMWAHYSAPVFIFEDNAFESGTYQSTQKFNNVAAYLDVKYEPPFLQGSYFAYRIDGLAFGKINNSDEPWDNDVLRHSLAMGYHITQNFLIRVMASTQHVETKKWGQGQRTFQVMLTGHY
jgi:hypothetical protein